MHLCMYTCMPYVIHMFIQYSYYLCDMRCVYIMQIKYKAYKCTYISIKAKESIPDVLLEHVYRFINEDSHMYVLSSALISSTFHADPTIPESPSSADPKHRASAQVTPSHMIIADLDVALLFGHAYKERSSKRQTLEESDLFSSTFARSCLVQVLAYGSQDVG